MRVQAKNHGRREGAGISFKIKQSDKLNDDHVQDEYIDGQDDNLDDDGTLNYVQLTIDDQTNKRQECTVNWIMRIIGKDNEVKDFVR